MPTIAAVAGAQSGTSTTRRSTSPSAIATPSPNSAVMRGSPIATTEPKVNSRMTAAATSPITSEPTGGACDRAATGPPTSTCRELSPASRMGSTRAAARAGVYSLTVMLRATSAYAVVPSSEIWAAPPSANGLAIPTTSSLRATSAKSASARSRTWGDVTPCSACSTTWTVSPARCGKLFSSASEAALDSDPGWR